MLSGSVSFEALSPGPGVGSDGCLLPGLRMVYLLWVSVS